MGSQVLDARSCVLAASFESTRGAGRHLVHRQHGHWFIRAAGAVLFADKATRAIGPSQVLGAVHLAINGASRLMVFTDHSVAGSASGYFIPADDLVASTFAGTSAVITESSSAARSGRK